MRSSSCCHCYCIHECNKLMVNHQVFYALNVIKFTKCNSELTNPQNRAKYNTKRKILTAGNYQIVQELLYQQGFRWHGR